MLRKSFGILKLAWYSYLKLWSLCNISWVRLVLVYSLFILLVSKLCSVSSCFVCYDSIQQ